MQDGAIVHLTEDGMQKLEVPDDHMVPCTHTSTFQRRWTCFLICKRFWNIRGVLSIEARQQHHLLCAEQCPKVMEKVSILYKYFFMSLFQILLRARAQEKKKTKMAYFLGLQPFFLLVEGKSGFISLQVWI